MSTYACETVHIVSPHSSCLATKQRRAVSGAEIGILHTYPNVNPSPRPTSLSFSFAVPLPVWCGQEASQWSLDRCSEADREIETLRSRLNELEGRNSSRDVVVALETRVDELEQVTFFSCFRFGGSGGGVVAGEGGRRKNVVFVWR